MNHSAQASLPITAPFSAYGMHADAILVATGVLLLTVSAKVQIRSCPHTASSRLTLIRYGPSSE